MNQLLEPDHEDNGQPLDNADQAGPAPAAEQAPDPEKTAGNRRLFSSAAIVGITLCVMLAALAVAAAGGMMAGQGERSLRATQTTAADIDLQFELAMVDLEAGRYELAEQRLAWIVSRVPDYPGAAERLAEVRRLRDVAANPIATAIPPSEADTLDERFDEAKALYESEQWEAAIARLQELRALDPAFRTTEVQQMLFQALSTLGVSYVRGDRIEEGIILLDQAALIQPLDDQVEGERLLATFYIAGRTYWGLNWPLVITNFEAIHRVAPFYRDVPDRLAEAYVRYADQLAITGAQCDAADQYQVALDFRFDPEVREKQEESTEACLNPTETPTPTLEPGEEGTPGPPDELDATPDLTPPPDPGLETPDPPGD